LHNLSTSRTTGSTLRATSGSQNSAPKSSAPARAREPSVRRAFVLLYYRLKPVRRALTQRRKTRDTSPALRSCAQYTYIHTYIYIHAADAILISGVSAPPSIVSEHLSPRRFRPLTASRTRRGFLRLRDGLIIPHARSIPLSNLRNEHVIKSTFCSRPRVKEALIDRCPLIAQLSDPKSGIAADLPNRAFD